MAKYDKVKVINEGPLSWVFFVAWIGAAMYFFQQDSSFWGFFVAIIKAAVWPGFVVYEVLGLLGV